MALTDLIFKRLLFRDGLGKATVDELVRRLDTSAAEVLPAGGTSGQVLAKTSNTDFAVGWVSDTDIDAPSRATRVTHKSADYAAVNGDLVLMTGTHAVTLPVPAANGAISVKNIDTGTVTVNPNGAENIDGANTADSIATQWQSVDYVSDGTDWFKV